MITLAVPRLVRRGDVPGSKPEGSASSGLDLAILAEKWLELPAMPQVKGLAFRSVLQAHASLRGKDSLEAMYKALEPELGQTLRSPLASAWYPLAYYAALWNAIQSTSGESPDYPRQIGRLCAEQDLKTVHKLLFAALNTTVALTATARMFGSYYDTGNCSAKRLDTRVFRFAFQGCVGFTVPMWTEVRGSLEVFVEQSTKATARSMQTQGGRAGDSHCVVDVHW